MLHLPGSDIQNALSPSPNFPANRMNTVTMTIQPAVNRNYAFDPSRKMYYKWAPTQLYATGHTSRTSNKTLFSAYVHSCTIVLTKYTTHIERHHESVFSHISLLRALITAESTSLICGAYNGQACRFTSLASNAATTPGAFYSSINKSHANSIPRKPTVTAFSSRCPVIHGGIWYDDDYCSSTTGSPDSGTVAQTLESSTTSSPEDQDSSSSSTEQGNRNITVTSSHDCAWTVSSDFTTMMTSTSHTCSDLQITAAETSDNGTSTDLQDATASVFNTTNIPTVESTKSSTRGSPAVTAGANVAVAGLFVVLIL